MSTFEEGTWVWIPSDESIVVPAYVMSTFSAGQAGQVRDEQGEGTKQDISRLKCCLGCFSLCVWGGYQGGTTSLKICLSLAQRAASLPRSTTCLTQNASQIPTTDPPPDRVITAEESQAITTCEAQCLDPEIDNLIKLNDLNENSILHNLRIRFKQDKIYTSVSSILISVNPFKMVSAKSSAKSECG